MEPDSLPDRKYIYMRLRWWCLFIILPIVILLLLYLNSDWALPTPLQLHFIFMSTWKQHVRDRPCETYMICVHIWGRRRKKGRDKDGVGGQVGLSFVLSECLLQHNERLSCCSPTRPLSLLGHAACIKMEGLHFCLLVHDQQTCTPTSPSEV